MMARKKLTPEEKLASQEARTAIRVELVKGEAIKFAIEDRTGLTGLGIWYDIIELDKDIQEEERRLLIKKRHLAQLTYDLMKLGIRADIIATKLGRSRESIYRWHERMGIRR